jgi:hypothetical protein
VPCRLDGVFCLPPLEFQTYGPKEVILQGEATHVDKPGRKLIKDQVEESRRPPQADDCGLTNLDPPEFQDVSDGAGRAVKSRLMAISRNDLILEHDDLPAGDAFLACKTAGGHPLEKVLPIPQIEEMAIPIN